MPALWGNSTQNNGITYGQNKCSFTIDGTILIYYNGNANALKVKTYDSCNVSSDSPYPFQNVT